MFQLVWWKIRWRKSRRSIATFERQYSVYGDYPNETTQYKLFAAKNEFRTTNNTVFPVKAFIHSFQLGYRMRTVSGNFCELMKYEETHKR